MLNSMNTTSSRPTAHRSGDFGLEIRKRLTKAFERISLIFPAIIIRRIAKRDLMDREVRQYELGYEARRRKLLVALRDKIAERQMRGK